MNHKKSVRVRFAPSPTGFLHVGGIRAALYPWLWARHNDGQFLLRIEDTDQSRKVLGAAEQIQESLRLLGITPDEPVVIQSERLLLYDQQAKKLTSSGSLYPCWCSTERLDELRTKAQKEKRAFKYDRHCLTTTNQLSLDQPHVLRFRIPETPPTISWDDAVRGRLEVTTDSLDDFVAMKSDGYPTYHLANVIDDHDMKISHVLRADEWLASTPKHLLLFAAFGWEPPIYAHLPAILGPDGKKKLSKRDGAKSVSDYIQAGYLPQALVNFLASLGWNDGTEQEIFTTTELIAKFTLGRVQKSPAKFDIERLNWMNGVYIRGLYNQEPLALLKAIDLRFWPQAAHKATTEYYLAVLALVYERLKHFDELPELTDFFFSDPVILSDLLIGKSDKQTVANYLNYVIVALKQSQFSHDSLEQSLRSLALEQEIKPGTLFMLIRLAVTGRSATPGLFEMLALLGKDTILRRLESASQKLSN